MSNKNKTHRCDFCGIEEKGVSLIRGLDDALICEFCVEKANEIINSQKISSPSEAQRPKLTPAAIKKHLDRSVVGQNRAKRLLAIAVYNHHKRISLEGYANIQKSNVMLIGPSGSGKTYMVQTLAKLLNLPLAIADASSLTKAGYIGDDVEGILSRLVMESKGDIKLAEKGIIFIDEIDKIAAVSNTDGKRDINGSGIQHEMLKIIEGSKVAINPEGTKKNSGSREVMIDTTNILFIVGGAFGGILDQKNGKSMGIGSSIGKHVDTNITHEDVIKYGFIPEFMGRIPVIAKLLPLTREDMRKILCDTQNNLLSQYKDLLKIDGVDVTFSDDFIDMVVDAAMKHPSGARSLRSIMEHSLENLLFDGPDLEEKDVVLTSNDFRESHE